MAPGPTSAATGTAAAAPPAGRPASTATAALAAVATLAAAALLYVVLAFALYPGSGGGNRSWCCDDTQILGHTLRFAPWRYFVEPEAWRALVPFSLTPWLSLSYRFDVALFGLAPAGFYAHQALALAACAGLIHLLCWRAAGHRAATLGALLFLAGAPVAQASQMLMVRHYVEGLAALLLCLWLVQQQGLRVLRGQGPAAWLALLAGLSFAVAASAKEVYLPLGLCAWLVAQGRWRQRLAQVWPVLLVMLLYVPWRAHMLGELVGGYTPSGDMAPARLALLAEAARQFAAVPAVLWAQPAWAGAGLALLAAAALAVQARVHGAAAAALLLLVGAAVLLLLAAPLLPLTVFPGIARGGERYFFAPWAALAIAVALACGRLRGGGRSAALPHTPPTALATALSTFATLVVAGVAASAWAQSRHLLAELAPLQREHASHFERLTRGGAGDVVIASTSVSAWFITGALALRPALGRTDPPPAVVVDEAQLAGLAAAGRRFWHDDGRHAVMSDAAATIATRLADWRGRVQVRPLAVEMAYDGPAARLSWSLQAPGQPSGGRFTLVAAGERLNVPAASGALRIEQPLPACFRIRHDGSDGSVAYSAWLRLPMGRERRSELKWQGPGDSLPGLVAAPACEAKTMGA